MIRDIQNKRLLATAVSRTFDLAPRPSPASSNVAPPKALLPAALLCLAFTPGTSLGADTTLPEVEVQGKGTGFRTPSTPSATRTETPMRDIPQFINEVPQQLIRSQGATSLADALRNAPGISYAAAETGTQNNQVYYLRGFPLNGDIYIDGVRDVGEYNRDLFATESVEVLKGPSGLLFGRGGSGGVINQTSKTADLLPRKEVELRVGSFQQKRVTGDVNVRVNDDSSLRLIALKEESGSFRYPQDVEKTGFAPSYWLRIGPATEATFSYYYLKTKDVTDYGQPTLSPAKTGTGQFAMAPITADKYYGYANYDHSDHETNIFTFKLEHEINNNVSVKNSLRIANYKRQVEASISTLAATDINGLAVTPATPLGNLMVTRNHDGGRTRDNDDDALINQTDVTWKFEGMGWKHTLVTGVEISREKLNRWNYTLDANPALAGTQIPTSTTPLFNPDPNTVLSYTKTPNQRALSQADALALYAQDQIELNKYWKAVAGLRWERYEGKARVLDYTTGVLASGPFERTDRMVSGRAGVIFQPTDTQSYYTSIANSYNPSGELGAYSATGTNLSLANQILDPEENRNYEVGGVWDVRGGLQVRSALFRTEKINQRINNSITGIPELAGKRRVEGVEVQVNGSITPNWDVYAGVAFQKGKIMKATANEGNTPLGVPDASGSVWTIYRLGGGWEVGGGVTASSGFWLTDGNNGAVPSYAVADLTVGYIQKRYEIRLNAYNITDKTYYLGGYNNAANRVLPGQPAALALTARYNFD